MSNKKEKRIPRVWGVPIGLSDLTEAERRELVTRQPPPEKAKKPSPPGRVGPEREGDIYSW